MIFTKFAELCKLHIQAEDPALTPESSVLLILGEWVTGSVPW